MFSYFSWMWTVPSSGFLYCSCKYLAVTYRFRGYMFSLYIMYRNIAALSFWRGKFVWMCTAIAPPIVLSDTRRLLIPRWLCSLNGTNLGVVLGCEFLLFIWRNRGKSKWKVTLVIFIKLNIEIPTLSLWNFHSKQKPPANSSAFFLNFGDEDDNLW